MESRSHHLLLIACPTCKEVEQRPSPENPAARKDEENIDKHTVAVGERVKVLDTTSEDEDRLETVSKGNGKRGEEGKFTTLVLFS
ncbi:hypothetical protein Trydic_g6206 [Trypoxylus dichotomus]